MQLSAAVIRLRWLVLAGWLAAAVLLVAMDQGNGRDDDEPASFLPADAPHSLAVAELKRAFPASSGISQATVLFERADGPLTDADYRAIERIADAIMKPHSPAEAKVLQGVTIQSPSAYSLLAANPLVSPDRRAALVTADVPANFITKRSARIVDHIRAVLAAAVAAQPAGTSLPQTAPTSAPAGLPPGLRAAVTGSSGLGHDYAAAASTSHQQTLKVTVAAVLIILLLVYRAPLATLIPLASISLAAVVTLKLLSLGRYVGLHVGTAEHIFVIVLLYGAGVDYSLLLVSRYRELLATAPSRLAAAGEALAATFGAIVTAAGTNIAALMMLCFARYGVFRSTGPAVAVALVVATLAATTLVPALVAIFGRGVFWPSRSAAAATGGGPWRRVADLVTRRPRLAMLVTLAAMALPAAGAIEIPWTYDTVSSLQPRWEAGVGNGAAGVEMARRHWPQGELSPAVLLVTSDAPLPAAQWQELSRRLTTAIGAVGGGEACAIVNVRSLSQPVGSAATAPARPAVSALFGSVIEDGVRAHYISADGRSMRVEAVLGCSVFTPPAMEAVRRMRQAAEGALAGMNLPARVHITGATAEMLDIRSTTRQDFHVVAAMAIGAILLVVVALLRDVVLSAFMVASTVLSYMATLGLASWFFTAVMGTPGLDWKVEVFLFVVMVAVGGDYNIFLVARLRQESARLDPLAATRLAIIHTGPVISSCGIIMAATLGSLMAGELDLLRQLGFTFALGMLIDTFIIRPLLVPSFVAATGRTGRRRSARPQAALPVE
jgi:RND superfamily putative drug exporter